MGSIANRFTADLFKLSTLADMHCVQVPIECGYLSDAPRVSSWWFSKGSKSCQIEFEHSSRGWVKEEEESSNEFHPHVFGVDGLSINLSTSTRLTLAYARSYSHCLLSSGESRRFATVTVPFSVGSFTRVNVMAGNQKLRFTTNVNSTLWMARHFRIDEPATTAEAW